jgi:hypothetical protein
MPRLSPNASRKERQERVHEEMHKFKQSTLHSGSPSGPLVKNRAQAVAISLSEAGMSKRKRRKKAK